MSGTVPYLGSKISLISKAEIRYEGVLYTIDPKESTVALAKVKSFGTEDRPTDRPVPPRDEIFEYIIFRGRDIKDLHVCAPPQMVGIPQDPAIVQSSEPTVLGGVGVGMPNQPSSFGSPNYPSSVELPGYAGPIGRQPPPGLQPLPQQLTGQVESEKPGAVQGQLVFGSPKSLAVGSVENSPSQSDAMHQDQPHGSTFDQQRENHRLNLSRRPPPRSHQSHSRGFEYNNRVDRPHASYGSEYSNRNHSYYPSGNYNRNQSYSMEYSNRNQYGPPRGRGGMRGSNHPQRSRGGGGSRGDSGLHFDGEFDFESSNAQFDKEQIEKELKEKLVIGDKADEREASEEEEEEDTAPAPIFYDKTKSFFDSISCEALDKSRSGGRPNWKEERKMNTETFGFSGGYNRRGGRGRGGRGYYARDRGGGGGGFGSMNSGVMGYRGPTYNRNQRGSFEQKGSGMMAART